MDEVYVERVSELKFKEIFKNVFIGNIPEDYKHDEFGYGVLKSFGKYSYNSITDDDWNRLYASYIQSELFNPYYYMRAYYKFVTSLMVETPVRDDDYTLCAKNELHAYMCDITMYTSREDNVLKSILTHILKDMTDENLAELYKQFIASQSNVLFCDWLKHNTAKLREIVTSDSWPSLKVFLSLPMSGLPEEVIIASIDRMKYYFKKEHPEYENVEFIHNYNEGDKPSIYYLGMAISKMAYCDCIYFAKDFEKSRGCKAEYYVATHYGIKILLENKADKKTDLPIISVDTRGSNKTIVSLYDIPKEQIAESLKGIKLPTEFKANTPVMEVFINISDEQIKKHIEDLMDNQYKEESKPLFGKPDTLEH